MASPNQLEKVYELCKNKDFRQQWEGLYHHQTMKYVRCQCVDLLADNVWQDVVKFQNAGEVDIVQKWAEKLLLMVVGYFDDKIDKNDGIIFSDKMTYQITRDDLKKNYENDPYRFIESLVTCLKEEELLIKRFTQPSEEQLQQENIAQTIQFFSESESHEQTLKREVKSLTSFMEDDKKLLTELAKKENQLKDLEAEPPRRANGVNSKAADIEMIHHEIVKIQGRLPYIHNEMENLKHVIKNTLRNFMTAGKELQQRFSDVIAKWRMQSKYKYVSLVDSDYTLTGMEDRCKNFGKLLFMTLHFIQDDLLVLSSQRWEMEQDVDLQDTIERLYTLFEEVCQCTFLVTDQTRHLIKVELGSKKRNKDQADDDETKPGKAFKCPKFSATVRLIGTECINGRQVVRAFFCHEDTLNELHKNNCWDDLEEKSFPLLEKGRSRAMPFGAKGFACFSSLELTNFKRDQDKHVCEEKYRIVFMTKQTVAGRTFSLRTISLPLIITTGASQGSNAHGSLLWQCFSVEDVMQFPLTTPSQLPWSTVSAMLNKKFKTLDGRDLRDDELLHLASRLSALPMSNINGQTEIQFRKFCLDKMMDVKESKEAKNKSATFWMWVLSVYNLTKFHLQDYWMEGLIDGFSSKEESEKKLKSIQPFKNYTFLLRFSNNVITDGQGQNMCGAISLSFVYKLENGDITVGHAKPFAAEKLRQKSLAKLVKAVRLKDNNKEVSLQYVHTGNQTREGAFTSFYQPSSKTKPKDYVQFEERLYIRLKDLSLDETVHKEEPVNDYPSVKKSRHCSAESYPGDQLMSLDKYEQPSPSSTLYGGDSRNIEESTPSPASSYMMSPDNRAMNGVGLSRFNSMGSPQSSASNGMTCFSPQSSIDEILSPEQEASIPLTVLDEISPTDPFLSGNQNSLNSAVMTTLNSVVNGNHGYNQTVQSFSPTQQYPTITKQLMSQNPIAIEELRKKLLKKTCGNKKQSEIDSNMQPQIDLNAVQKELTQDELALAITIANSYPGEVQPLMTFAMSNDAVNIGMQEVEILQDNSEQTHELSDEDMQQLVLDPNLYDQLNQMVQNPERAQQFGTLMNVFHECCSENNN